MKCGMAGLLVAIAIPLVAHAQVWNGKFSGRITAPTDLSAKQARIEQLRRQGWTCPDAKDWPWGWDGQGDRVTIEWPAAGGVDNDRHGRISGGINGYVNGYWGQFFKGHHILTFRARGKGTLRVGLMAWKYARDRKTILSDGGIPGFTIKVDSPEWVRYRYLMKKPDWEVNGHPLFQAQEGKMDFDDVDIIESDPALDLIVGEENALYGTGALVENLRYVAANAPFQARTAAYREAVKSLRAKAATLDPKLVKGLEQSLAALDPYVLTKGITTVAADNYNDMLVMTRVCRKLADGKDDPIQPATATAASVANADAPGFYPGRRDPRPDAVTITNVRSNKVRYVENEGATTTATIVNRQAAAFSGTVKARMIVDLDTVRELAGGPFSIGPGEEKKWTFNYNVGPETYGRAIEVQLVAGNGHTLDKWREYYAVAAEFFRVHQHCFNTETKYFPADPFIFYFNQSHYFAYEPTDFGIEPYTAEVYKSGQAGYQINAIHRKGQIAHNKQVGIATSYYVTGAFGGQMGYEQARQHPEYVLYDANGQWAADPVYGGYPNPMEIASPLEVGPKRKDLKIKPYLDRIYSPWQHVGVNMASEDAVVWGLERMKKYADDNVRAAAEGRNIMMLDEHANFQGYDYQQLLANRLKSRDHYVQKYGVSHQIGPNATPAVDMHNPGPAKWGWPSCYYTMLVLRLKQ